MSNVYKKLGNYIRTEREKKNITQLELAKELGFETSQFVSLFERGLSKIPNNVLGKLIKKFEIDSNEIINILIDDYKKRLIKELKISGADGR